MTNRERLAQLREHWPTLLGIVIAVAWIGWRHGIDLAAALVFLLACIARVNDRVERVTVVQLAAGALLQTTAHAVAAQLIRDGAKVPTTQPEETVH